MRNPSIGGENCIARRFSFGHDLRPNRSVAKGPRIFSTKCRFSRTECAQRTQRALNRQRCTELAGLQVQAMLRILSFSRFSADLLHCELDPLSANTAIIRITETLQVYKRLKVLKPSKERRTAKHTVTKHNFECRESAMLKWKTLAVRKQSGKACIQCHVPLHRCIDLQSPT